MLYMPIHNRLTPNLALTPIFLLNS